MQPTFKFCCKCFYFLVAVFGEQFGDALLKNQLDKLAVSFKTAQPDFYSTFFNARIIIDSSKTKMQIKGIIADAVTKVPIVKATVQQVVGSSTSTKLTNAQGKFIFKPPTAGTYELKV